MKFFVNKSTFLSSAFGLIILDAIILAVAIWVAVTPPEGIVKAVTLLWLGICVIIVSFLPVKMIVQMGSSIVFDENNIKCVFLKRVRRMMVYDEINDIGTAVYGNVRFIYMSRFELSESQRNREVFVLYKKTKDVLVLQYRDEIMEHLKAKCPHISPKFPNE